MMNKTHLILNHSPITQLVIQEILKRTEYQDIYSQILIISTRNLQLNHPQVDEIKYQQEKINHSLEHMFAFFYDNPPYRFSDQLTVLIPQTRYEIGRFLLQSSWVKSISYLEEGVGSVAYGKLPTIQASSAKNTYGAWSNHYLYRLIKTLGKVSIFLYKYPHRIKYLSQIIRFYFTPIHFIWQPHWHSKISQILSFHSIWPDEQQVILNFPQPTQKVESKADALLLLPHKYGDAKHQLFFDKIEQFFKNLDPNIHILVKCHPSDYEKYWFQQSLRLHDKVQDVGHDMPEAALYCSQKQLRYCFHFNSSCKEYFKFLPTHQKAQTLVIDLWSQDLNFQDILDMTQSQQQSLQAPYEFS